MEWIHIPVILYNSIHQNPSLRWSTYGCTPPPRTTWIIMHVLGLDKKDAWVDKITCHVLVALWRLAIVWKWLPVRPRPALSVLSKASWIPIRFTSAMLRMGAYTAITVVCCSCPSSSHWNFAGCTSTLTPFGLTSVRPPLRSLQRNHPSWLPSKIKTNC